MAEPNAIHSLLRAKLDALNTLIEGVDRRVLPHHGVRGQMLEDSLRDFLSEVIPSGFAIKSGFICDPNGGLTPQLDLVILDPRFMPPIALTGDAAVVPIEAALMYAEVKSTLRKADFDQIDKQLEAIGKLRYSRGTKRSLPLREDTVQSVILARNSEGIGEKQLEAEFKQRDDLKAICIFDRITLLKTDGAELECVKKGDGPNRYRETISFVTKMYHTLQDLSGRRETAVFDFGEYLQ